MSLVNDYHNRYNYSCAACSATDKICPSPASDDWNCYTAGSVCPVSQSRFLLSMCVVLLTRVYFYVVLFLCYLCVLCLGCSC